MKSAQLSHALNLSLQAALTHHQAGERAQAEALYRKVLKAIPRQPIALHYCGLLLHEAGDSDRGVALMERSVAAEPDNPECHHDLAGAYLEGGQPDRAILALRRAVRFNPGFAAALASLGELYVRLGRPAEAAPCFEKLAALHPEDATAHCNLAIACASLTEFEKALRHFQRAVELQPAYAAAYKHLGWTCLRLGLHEWARKYCGRAVELEPGYADAHRLLGAIALEQGNFAAAAGHCRDAVAQGPADAGAHLDLGRALARLGQAGAAFASFRQAIALDPQGAAAHEELVAALFASGATDAAMDHHWFGCATLALPPLRRATVTSVRAYCAVGHGDYRLIARGEGLRIPDPAYIGARFDARGGDTLTNDLYVAGIEQAAIVGRGSPVRTRTGVVLDDNIAHSLGEHLDLGFEAAVRARYRQDLLLDESGLTTVRAERGVHLTGASSVNYGHWFTEYLPKLQLLAAHPDFTATPIYVDQDMPASHFRALHLLTAGTQRIERVPPRSIVRFDHLLVAPTRTFFPFVCKPETALTVAIGSFVPDAFASMRDTLLAALGLSSDPLPAAGRRIFLARQTKGRALVNEEALQRLFARHGFEIVFPARLDFDAQVRLFNQADCIAGPNGSAFFNLLFCRRGARVISFVQRHGANFAAWAHLVESLGHRHLYVAGDAIAGSSWHEHHLDYEVAPDLARQALDYHGIARQ